MNYAKAVRLLRATKDLTQKELAERAKIDPAYLSMIETGRRNPSRDMLERLAGAAEIPTSLLHLLASERDDLRNVSEKQAETLGKQLLELLVGDEQSDARR